LPPHPSLARCVGSLRRHHRLLHFLQRQVAIAVGIQPREVLRDFRHHGRFFLADLSVLVLVHRSERGIDRVSLLAEACLLIRGKLGLVDATVLVAVHRGEGGIDIGLFRVGWRSLCKQRGGAQRNQQGGLVHTHCV